MSADEEDYEAKVRLLAEEMASQHKVPYTLGDVNDVRICLARGTKRRDIHLEARIPRYRVQRVLKDYRL